MKKLALVLLLGLGYCSYSTIRYLAESRQMVLCYYTGNPYGFDSYKCELVPRDKGY